MCAALCEYLVGSCCCAAMQPSADTPLPGNGGVSGAVYSLPFGAQLPDPFATCAGAGSHLTRLSGPRFCGYSFCSRLLSYSVVGYVIICPPFGAVKIIAPRNLREGPCRC